MLLAFFFVKASLIKEAQWYLMLLLALKMQVFFRPKNMLTRPCQGGEPSRGTIATMTEEANFKSDLRRMTARHNGGCHLQGL